MAAATASAASMPDPVHDSTGPSTTSSSSVVHSAPWVEKYRPKTLSDVAHQDKVVATLQNAVKTGRLPHLLLYGPAGSGKTTTALALCRQLWGPQHYKKRVLELNASDERGLSVVRDKIKHFASLTVAKTNKKKSFFQKNKNDDDPMEVEEPEYPNPPFKIIILDEADTVTKDAQAALRRIIEAHSKQTRFILICNYVTRVIEPLASRCAKFRFQPLPATGMEKRLQEIGAAEHVHASTLQLLPSIMRVADGDMRKAVTTLQSLHALEQASSTETVVNEEDLQELAGQPPASAVQALFRAMTAANHASFADMQRVVDETVLSGFSAVLLLQALLPVLTSCAAMGELQKAEVALAMAHAERCMLEGADEHLQLLHVCSVAHQTCTMQQSARQ